MVTLDMLTDIVDNADVGLYISDFYTGEIVFVNNKFAATAQCPPDQLIGQKCWKIVNKKSDKRCPFCPYEKLIDKNGNPLGKYSWELFLPESGMWFKSVNQVITWTDGRLVQLVTFHDITEMKKMQETLANLAFIDQKSQLKNALSLEKDIIAEEIAPSLIAFDISSMQKINEAYGRDVGDMLLKSISDWILEQNIPNSEFYRIGGDEFCLVIKRITQESLIALSETINQKFLEPWIFRNFKGSPCIFWNAYIAAIHGEFISKIEDESPLNMIERTLKSAKHAGRVMIYDEEMDRGFKKRLQLELSLKRCVHEGMRGFDVYYQPIADPVTGIWCGLEALCRWDSPELGRISPLAFIAEAERLGLIADIGIWVLETAIKKCKEWSLDKHKKFVLDVNLSAAQFFDEMLAHKIIKILCDNDYPGEKLSIEITESTQFTFTDKSLNTINMLKEHKVLVALDDFGTGYSSFNNLQSLPVNILKIERVFVTDIETNSYQQYLFHIMADLAHAVNMTLIAEGVENKEQMDILLKNGADLLQGYLFSKPMPPEVLETQLHRFYEVDESFSIIRNRKIDIKKLTSLEANCVFTPGQYKMLNQCMRILFSSSDTNKAISQVLQITGEYLNISHAYIFMHKESNIFIQTQEWCAEGINPHHLQSEQISAPDYWISTLTKEGIILSNDTAILPEELKDTLIDPNTKSIIVFPLWEGNHLAGFVGFDDCNYYRDWRPEEVLMLYNLCVVIMSTTKKNNEQNSLILKNDMMENILNGLDMFLYVSDVETGKILFANNYTKNIFGFELEGKICWNVFHGYEKRCGFCNISLLKDIRDSSKNSKFVWDFYANNTNKRFCMYDCLVSWVHNETAYLCYGIDITDL